jgi:hypothetical protein
MSLLICKKQRGRKNGFTIVELITAMLVGTAILGVVVMLLSTGIRMMTSNVAYSAAQRGALSTVEMLSKEIPAALKVEIITDESVHNVSAGLADGWHYVTLNPDSKEARHIYQEYDETVDEKIPGSEYIEALSFDTEIKNKPGGGGRLLRVYVDAAYGTDEAKMVDLDKTMLVRAASGVTGDSSAGAVAPPPPSAGGALLRYLPENQIMPKLAVYGTSVDKKFDYDSPPQTWDSLKVFNYDTKLDARLELPPRLLKPVKESGEDVIFTWIVVDPTIFKLDVVNSDANKDPEAILAYLEKRVPEYLEREEDWNLLKEIYDIDETPDEDGNLPEETIAELLDDPFNMGAEDPKAKGFQLMNVTRGQLIDENSGLFDIGTKKFNVGDALNGLTVAYDYYRGAYMIVVAKFSDGKGGWKKWPVYVQLGTYEDDTLFTEIITQVAEKLKDAPNTHIGDTFLNTDYKYGTLDEVEMEGERRYFEVTGNKKGGGAAPIVMKKLTPNDFSHMIPRGATKKDDILYGVTNYAVYVDAEVRDSGSGGYAVVLNGSKVHVNGSPLDESDKDKKYGKDAEYTTGGHYFQFDPGANGLVIRYFAYQPHVDHGFGQTDIFVFGTRPMYFYDATKENFPAPGVIEFFKTASGPDFVTKFENFNENAGAGTNDKINYRIPFSALARRSMYDIQGTDLGKLEYLNTTINFSDKMEGRDEDNGGTYRGPFYPAYGVTIGTATGFGSIYSPKHMQSWHNYNYPEEYIVDMAAPNASEDKRIGFRWDRSWHLELRKKIEPNSIWQNPVWEQRHILKLTILEVTRDITAGEVDEEWRYNIHHRNDNPLTGGQLTKLADDYVIHKSGDMFVRAELIQLKPGATDWNNSRNYVYSKPVWYGKFKGDAWRGDDQSPFKKLGNTMQHIVADPEPEEGDDQSYRRRGMRVRSWKESFLGWDFSKVTRPNYRYVWRDFVNGGKETYDKDEPFGVSDSLKGKRFPPDFYESVYADGVAGRVDSDKTKTAHSVWTPPLEIDLNADSALSDENENKLFTSHSNVRNVSQSGDSLGDASIPIDKSAKTFGQYMNNNNGGQYVERERRPKSWGGYVYAYNGKYKKDTPLIYGRLSFLRPWRDALPNQTTPIFGLYAMRGWDFGTSRMRDDKDNNKVRIYDSTVNTPKRFLTVVQGLQLPFYPQKLKVWANESESSPRDMSPGGNVFKPDRDRVIGFRFWDNGAASDASKTRLYDTWIGEGFSPREVRAILGLKTNDPTEIRGTYVHEDMEEADFYVPLGEGK